jgi:hypothetical protein
MHMLLKKAFYKVHIMKTEALRKYIFPMQIKKEVVL